MRRCAGGGHPDDRRRLISIPARGSGVRQQPVLGHARLQVRAAARLLLTVRGRALETCFVREA